MSGGSRIADEWIIGLRESLNVLGALVRERPVAAAWSAASELDGYSVGGIAGHVLSLMTGLQARIEEGDSRVEPIAYEDWYRSAIEPGQVHSRLIEAGEELAALGPTKVAVEFAATAKRLDRSLRDSSPDLLVPLRSIPGTGVSVEDFLRTRFVEIVVHADDIAASIGLPCPEFPPIAWALASSVLAETTQHAGTGSQFVLSAARPNRAARP